ncbi:MAG: DUF6526 family protein [Planctomycetota bacterium]|nr:DUF6526 family protein [Planctomycetota bacterium]
MPKSPERPQDFSNHRAIPNGFWLAAGIVLLADACWRAWEASTGFSARAAWSATVAIALVVVWFSARRSAQIVQDRVIRLEMRLRLQRLLGDERREDIERIAVADLVGLRFASDPELPGLVARLSQGEFAKPDDIKRAVRSWRADWLRV